MKARELEREIRSLGFVRVPRRKGHPIYRHPQGGPQLVVSGSPGDYRSAKNSLADAQRIVRGLA